ncbi:MAG: diguanylate cyclase domain protein [Variovorax sp.]|jgi:diguanylate cyclase (GGDEF)-like protein|nr:diguanylate cyclase domain protein [Variovorax sp.]
MAEGAADEALLQFLYRAPVGLIQTTLDGTVVLINPMSAQLLLPLAPDGNLDNLFDVLQAVAPGLRDLANASASPGDLICDALALRIPRKNRFRDEPHTLALHMTRLDDTTLMACVSDITASEQREYDRLEARLHGEKRTDPLTLLANRTAMLEHIERALGRLQDDPGYQFVVVLVNADRFERINVTLGQSAGDEVLRLMGHRITAAMAQRSQSPESPGALTAMAARLSGDEFAICVDASERDSAAADDFAHRLVSALQKPYVIGDGTVHLAASVGLVSSATSSQDAGGMLEHASLAMREAKRLGGARHAVFEPGLLQQARQRGDLEIGLRSALAEGQLFTVYQPIVDLLDGSVAGMEALVRWRHPERGVVMPSEFIDVAEATGLICDLGAWVLSEACRQLVAWQSLLGDRAPRTISVNLSRAQLADSKVVGRVSQALTAAGLRPACLQLEVTESLAAQDEHVRARLSDLKELGLALSLDDFGTGYSSLASLHELPVDVVKIDRSFVSPMETSAHHRVLIAAVVGVARSLGMRTVAEGIETEGQATLLTALGCNKGQGYFYSRPLPAEGATAWLASYESPFVVLKVKEPL